MWILLLAKPLKKLVVGKLVHTLTIFWFSLHQSISNWKLYLFIYFNWDRLLWNFSFIFLKGPFTHFQAFFLLWNLRQYLNINTCEVKSLKISLDYSEYIIWDRVHKQWIGELNYGRKKNKTFKAFLFIEHNKENKIVVFHNNAK